MVYHLSANYQVVSDIYNGLVEDLGSKVDRTEKNVKEIADRLSTKFAGRTHGDQDIPLEPLQATWVSHSGYKTNGCASRVATVTRTL
jgi:hypothetical protein